MLGLCPLCAKSGHCPPDSFHRVKGALYGVRFLQNGGSRHGVRDFLDELVQFVAGEVADYPQLNRTILL